jgi:hypothetical protein
MSRPGSNSNNRGLMKVNRIQGFLNKRFMLNTNNMCILSRNLSYADRNKYFFSRSVVTVAEKAEVYTKDLVIVNNSKINKPNPQNSTTICEVP